MMTMYRICITAMLMLVGGLCSAEDVTNSSMPDETTAIRELRKAGATIEVDSHGHAISLNWDTSTDGSFTDKHLQVVATLGHLKELWLEHTDVTDLGLARLKSMKQLETLALICKYETGKAALITDAGLKQLVGLTNLRVLRLDNSDVTDAGLVHLKALTNLEDLDLFGTEISDAGLVHLQGLKKLKFLGISETQWEKTRGAITSEAALALQKHLPKCQIYY